MDFVGFSKIARLSREIVITEKIDGTNSQIFIGEDGEFLTGSRTRWITPEMDNHGFAGWAQRHKDELIAGLGIGRHFGEFWGSGINRGYGLEKGAKRFSLFNTNRWGAERDVEKYPVDRPECCDVVPVLYVGQFCTEVIKSILSLLEKIGSRAAEGFMNPEGVVIYHTAANMMFKKTIKNDEKGKGN